MENNLVSNGLDVTCNRTKFSDLTSKEIFGGDSGCPQSGSTGDNPRLKSHNSEQNTLKMLREMKEAMGVPALELQTINKGEDFEEEFSSYFKTIYSDKSYLIHSQFVVKVIKKIASEKYGENNYYQLLLDSEFLTEVLKELEKTNSYKKRKTILRKICKFYYDKLNLSRLNIERNKCVNLLNWYGKKSIHHVGVELEIHPKVQEFIDYLTQVGQTWQKRARLNASSFLTWLVETKEVDQDNPIHINVRQIKSETLYKYRNYLLMRVELKQITKDSAQLQLRSIRRWFEFLKLRRYIHQNPCNSLDNIKVVPKEKGELLPVETVRKFFDALWEDKEALKWLSLFTLMATDGLRSIEGLRLKRSDVLIKQNAIKIKRKGGNKQILPIPGITSLFLELYLKSSPENSDALIWKNSIGTPLTYDELRYFYHRFRIKAGIETKGATHFFRRLLFSELAYQTNDLDKIKELAGHKSIKHLDPYLFAKKTLLSKRVKEQLPTMGGEYCDFRN